MFFAYGVLESLGLPRTLPREDSNCPGSEGFGFRVWGSVAHLISGHDLSVRFRTAESHPGRFRIRVGAYDELFGGYRRLPIYKL